MGTITWVIEWMQCRPVEGDLTNVVVTAGWRCNGEEQGQNTTAYGSCSFPTPGDPFTPYADLTQDQVLGWCWDNGVNKDETEAAVQQQLNNLINPPVVQEPLPWA